MGSFSRKELKCVSVENVEPTRYRPPSPSPPQKKEEEEEEEEAPGNIGSDLGQDRNSVVTYHHSLTHSP